MHSVKETSLCMILGIGHTYRARIRIGALIAGFAVFCAACSSSDSSSGVTLNERRLRKEAVAADNATPFCKYELFAPHGVVTALNADTGVVKWTKTTGWSTGAPSALLSDSVIVTATQTAYHNQTKFTAYRATQGKTMWERTITGLADIEPILIERTLFARVQEAAPLRELPLVEGEGEAQEGTAPIDPSLVDRSDTTADDDAIFASKEKVDFLALDIFTGERRWKHPFPSGKIWGNAGPLLFVEDEQGLAAIHVHTGDELWRENFRSSAMEDLDDLVVAPAAGKIFLASSSGVIEALDAASGIRQSVYHDLYEGEGTPQGVRFAVVDDVLVVHFVGTSRVMALDLETETQLWQTDKDNIDGLDTVGRHTVLAHSDSLLSLYAARTGELLWSLKGRGFGIERFSDSVFALPFADRGAVKKNVLFATHNTAGRYPRLRAVDLVSGKVKWQISGKQVPLAFRSKLYVMKKDKLVAVSAETGKVVWSRKMKGDRFSLPFGSGQLLFLLSSPAFTPPEDCPAIKDELEDEDEDQTRRKRGRAKIERGILEDFFTESP